jgi:FKBP-type peptidyl-prolyl cis-trans isomerase FkpA
MGTRKGLTIAAAGLALAGCAAAGPAAVATDSANLTPQARWEAGQAAYLAWNAKRPGWRTTASGLESKCIQHGARDAPKPAPGATVTIHYVGTFIDGQEFDSSRRRGEPATFPLGRLIKGWQEGVPTMRVGDRCLFAIPAALGYGDRTDRAPIPPGSALLFDIELLAIPPAAAG